MKQTVGALSQREQEERKKRGFAQRLSEEETWLICSECNKAGVMMCCAVCLISKEGMYVELLMLLDLHLKRREMIFEVCVGGQQMVSTKNIRRKLVFVCKQGLKVTVLHC